MLEDIFTEISLHMRTDPDRIIALLDSIGGFTEMGLQAENIPPMYHKKYGRKIKLMSRRKWIETMNVWHLLDAKSINALVTTIKEWGNVKMVEIGAGMGFLAYFLRHYGLDVIATDDYSWMKDKTPYTEVLKMNYEESLIKYNPDVLIVCWGASPIPIELFKGEYYIYIGELPGGCTDGYPNDEWKIIKEIEMPCFYGINDENIIIFERIQK